MAGKHGKGSIFHGKKWDVELESHSRGRENGEKPFPRIQSSPRIGYSQSQSKGMSQEENPELGNSGKTPERDPTASKFLG